MPALPLRPLAHKHTSGRRRAGAAAPPQQRQLAENKRERRPDAPRGAREPRRQRKARKRGPEKAEGQQADAHSDEHQVANVLCDAVAVGRRRRDEVQLGRALRADSREAKASGRAVCRGQHHALLPPRHASAAMHHNTVSTSFLPLRAQHACKPGRGCTMQGTGENSLGI